MIALIILIVIGGILLFFLSRKGLAKDSTTLPITTCTAKPTPTTELEKILKGSIQTHITTRTDIAGPLGLLKVRMGAVRR